MKKILLINPKLLKKSYQLSIPMGLMHVGSYLHYKGYSVNIIDANNFENQKDFFNKIKNELGNALCVGLSVMSAQIPNALKTSKYIREFDASIPIIWGGVHPTLYPEQTVEDTHVDLVVIGEGEVTTFKLIEAIEGHKDFSQVKGVAFWSNLHQKVIMNSNRELIDINKLPPIEWNLLEDIRSKGITKIVGTTIYFGGVPIQTSRGCPHRCTFCINTVLKNKYRYREAGIVLNDIKRLIDLGVDRIYFIDEDFFANRKRFVEILNGIEQDKLIFNWFANIRADYFRENYITRDLLERMKKSGCEVLGIGAESGSEKILNKLKKDITVDDTLNAAKRLNEIGINGTFSFMVGLLGEEKEDMEKTWELIKKIRKINNFFLIIGPQIYRPYPGSLLFLECLKSGMKEPNTLAEWASSSYIEGREDKIPREDYDKYSWIAVSMNYMNEWFDRVFYMQLCDINLRSSIITKILRKIARMRYEKSYFKYPIERMVADALRGTIIGKIILKGISNPLYEK
jgi:radical SAM superfamily enzyme YgiQ (UPF0313 family)